MVKSQRAVADVWVLASWEAAPGHGVLPVNAYVVTGDRPVLIDTGLPMQRQEFLDALWSLIPPSDLAAVFLTHEDADHAGNLTVVLDAAPQCRLVTNFVSLGRVLESTSVPLDRVDVVNPGEPVPGTDGRLTVLRPPLYDSPGTMGLHDTNTGVVFTVDAFGTYLPRQVEDLDGMADSEVVEGLVDFNRMNHPWVALADPARFGAAIRAVAEVGPTLLLSSHGAVPRRRTELLLAAFEELPAMAPHVAPDQAAFEQLRAEFTGE